MNNEKPMEEQELIQNISDDIWEQTGLSNDDCDNLARVLFDKYAIKKKKAYTLTYTISKTIYTNNREEAAEICGKMSLEDMGDDGAWLFKEEE